MQMKIQLNDKKNNPTFKGVLDAPLTSGLRVLGTNPMLNASMIDIFAMDTPRTIVEYKERNKYAGAEMAFREFTGTFIACFSAGLFGQMINKIATKFVKPETKVNQNSWVTNNTLEVLNNIWESSNKTTKSYTEKFFGSLSGLNKDKYINWQEINWEKINWYDKNSWTNFKWDDKNLTDIHKNLKTQKAITENFERLISDKNLTKNDSKKLLEILTSRIINTVGSESDITLKNGGKSTSSTIQNILRDSIDLGKNVFTGKNVENSLKKLKQLNGIKTIGALGLSVALALTNQALNRYLTKKRTGSEDFVGNMSYVDDLKSKNKKGQGKRFLNLGKTIASVGFVAMLGKVMNIKSGKDFLKKLEFTGATTSGNAIKTIYGALILGRFLAAKDNTELRETVVRDYLGFLNWLVLGGFVSKGVAQILDPKKENLFNISKKGKGISHWLKNLSLKTHAEIAAQGGKNLKGNIRKLNIAHISGLLYSAVMLGVFLPKLNIWMTKKKQVKNIQNIDNLSVNKTININKSIPPVFKSFMV